MLATAPQCALQCALQWMKPTTKAQSGSPSDVKFFLCDLRVFVVSFQAGGGGSSA